MSPASYRAAPPRVGYLYRTPPRAGSQIERPRHPVTGRRDAPTGDGIRVESVTAPETKVTDLQPRVDTAAHARPVASTA